MSERTECTVVRIVDAETLVLNLGWSAGVVEGMHFAVVQPCDEITDGEGGASLGRWEMVKAVLVVTHAQERMATARPVARGPLSRSGDEASPGGAVLSAQMIRDSMPRENAAEHRPVLDATHASGRPRTEPIRVGDLARSIPVSAP